MYNRFYLLFSKIFFCDKEIFSGILRFLGYFSGKINFLRFFFKWNFQVQEAISKNLSGHTVLVVAHRLSTVENADKIVVINHGRVEQIGIYKELAEVDGLFRTLVQKQLKSLFSNVVAFMISWEIQYSTLQYH